MSKYDPLWQYIKDRGEDSLCLTFDDIAKAAGVPIDHSFLNCKKELESFGYTVEKISLKDRTVAVKKLH